ncbi:thiamine phosphate synthase [Anaerofustis stercorihominis]|uniref:Thiamine-phosphate synthase n=3 Tax=Anaerofustis stercorihominis TaxID=214853 RepID=B1C7E9_9FIRM|nr:thiamine phosphate synthase [Anaerofustis stercorihominis]EDS72936.1 thiamine-phosphate diphosphorylase [Anaerofustis stercorihominis DSM 17244]MCQ4794308.1 thiamine phosphate synthase [Anaerofustis stercorihominis]RGD74526.1 thiamine phosphate synthase [Anaerofustis stercorihominis]
MKVNSEDMLLYAVTDRAWTESEDLYSQVKKALKGGITFLQLREKELDEETFLKEALKIKELAKEYDVPFVINDNVDIAVKSDADGVHVGQSDMEAGDVRKKIGKDKILGVSASNLKEAKLAEEKGADYLGVGAVFSTSTKLDADEVSFDTLKEICDNVSIPVVAIGGISKDNILKLKGTNVDGVAVVSAIFASSDIVNDTKELLKLSKEMVKGDK